LTIIGHYGRLAEIKVIITGVFVRMTMEWRTNGGGNFARILRGDAAIVVSTHFTILGVTRFGPGKERA
jgi:hypothetical protein